MTNEMLLPLPGTTELLRYNQPGPIFGKVFSQFVSEYFLKDPCFQGAIHKVRTIIRGGRFGFHPKACANSKYSPFIFACEGDGGRKIRHL